jgi:arylsulfatase A-like enzyme
MPFALYGAMGIGLGLACGLVWSLLSFTPFHRRLAPAQLRAWELGLVVGILFFFVSFNLVNHHALVLWDIKLRNPFIPPLLLSLSVALAFSARSAAVFLHDRKRLRTILTITVASALALSFCNILYWQYKFNFKKYANKALASTKLRMNSSGSQPNVMLITVDTLRADHLSAYGYTRIRTKNIDRLAKEGVLFEQAIAQSSWTRPSFGSIWTSLYPSQHQADWRMVYQSNNKRATLFNRGLREDVSTIAEFFSDAGYVTVGLNTNPQLSKAYGFDRGFQLFIDGPIENILRKTIIYDMLNKYTPFMMSFLQLNDYWYLPAETVNQITNQIIEKLKLNRGPFFLWVHFLDSHTPYYAHEKIVAKGRVFHTIDDFEIENLIEDLNDTTTTRNLFIKIYDGEILYLDYYIGKILNQLRKLDLLDNTLVVLTSDHGEEFFDHGRSGNVEHTQSKSYYRGWGHGHTMYDELIRIPLVMRFPKKKYAKRKVTSLAQHIDLLPTLLAFSGISGEKSSIRFEGINLLNYLNDKKVVTVKYARSESNHYIPEIKQIRSKNYKLIYHTIDQASELYDLTSDPLEQNNIAEVNEETHRKMFSALKIWMTRMNKENQRDVKEEALSAGKKESRTKHIDQTEREELKERLKALGYVQ